MDVYPIYLTRLNTCKTILIGGGEEAERKTRELLECNARLTVIGASVTRQMREWAENGRVEWIRRPYRSGDLHGAFMAIVADYDGDLNERVHEEAIREGILINVMDDIPHANFAFGSMVRRGNLTLSISTSGVAPALAVRLRERFEKEFGPEYEEYLDLLQSLRNPISAGYPDAEERKKIWYRLVDSDILDCFRLRDYEGIYRRITDIAGEEIVRQITEPEEQS